MVSRVMLLVILFSSVFIILIVSFFAGSLSQIRGGLQNVTKPPGIGEFCGSSTNGACASGADCIAGGCSDQVCQSRAEEPVITTCEFRECYDDVKYNVRCGCVAGKCQWS